MKFNLLAGVVLLAIVASSQSRADGFDRSKPEKEQRITSDTSVPAIPDDDRLPPVLPGQIVDNAGEKMRVWSSAGPVPVSPPNAPAAGVPGVPGAGGIIIDERDWNKNGPRPVPGHASDRKGKGGDYFPHKKER